MHRCTKQMCWQSFTGSWKPSLPSVGTIHFSVPTIHFSLATISFWRLFSVLSEYYSHNTNHPFSLWHPYDKQGERRRQGLPSNESVAHCGKILKTCLLEKYKQQFWEIQTPIWRNTNNNHLEKYKQEFGEMQTTNWRNTNNTLEKYKQQQSGEIQTTILRNKNNTLEKYKQKQTVNWNATQMYVNTM